MEPTSVHGPPQPGWVDCGNGSWVGGLPWQGKGACCVSEEGMATRYKVVYENEEELLSDSAACPCDDTFL